jgi:hypothetical protein
VRSDLLEKYPRSDVHVYVVWFNMLPADSRNLVDRKVLNDRRATNFYDPNRLVGAWFADHANGGVGIVWDAYFLYPAAAMWADQPQPLLSSGGPVIEASSDLAAAFAKLNPAATAT